MAKVSPIVRSLNAGEFSALMEGRVDIDRYASSLRQMENFVPTPQGPAIARSGTALQCPVWDEAKRSKLQAFVFNETQSWQIEFSGAGVLVFVNEDGPICYPGVAITAAAGNVATAAGHGCSVGDRVVLSGFGGTSGLNGERAKVTAVAGNDVTLDKALTWQAGAQLARVYTVASPYAEADLDTIRTLQSADVMYIFSDQRTRKLSRYGLLDWRLTDFAFADGPYMDVNDTGTRLTPDVTGLYTMASIVAVSSGTQASENVYDAGAAILLAGYTIHLPTTESANTDYSNKDQAFSTWTVEGSTDNVNFTVLDRQQEYVLYTGNRSVYFPLKYDTPYRYYKFKCTACVRNGPISPVGTLSWTSKTAASITLTASSTTGINNDAGFKSTDVGRQVRMKQGDGWWRALAITEVVSATVVKAKPQAEALYTIDSVSEWRLGAFCDTNGWPTTGAFFEDRLVTGGAVQLPDLVACSATGSYEAFPPSDGDGTVTAANAIVFQLNSRRLSRVAWISSDERGLLIGTGSQEWVVAPADANQALSGANIRARSSTARGSARMEPVKVDRTVLFVQRARRTVREFVYVFQADGYQSPSMSLFSSHIGGVSPFAEIDYAAEPHSLIWARRDDGSLACLTYNREENVVGWSRHPLAEGGFVESISVMPAKSGELDTLWLIVRRTVGGVTRRFIERLMPFWDFTSTLEDAHFVDCALRYQGEPAEEIYGLQHLEGATVYGLADGGPIPPVVVTGGKITLQAAASNVVVGLGFDAVGEIARPEAGAADGTAQGKTKRVHNVTLRIWQTGGGEVGRPPSESLPNGDMQPLVHRRPDEPFGIAQPLRTEDYGPVALGGGYDKDGTIMFRRPKELPLPFNLIAIMPQLNTQDR